jgi:hypothetical protein
MRARGLRIECHSPSPWPRDYNALLFAIASMISMAAFLWYVPWQAKIIVVCNDLIALPSWVEQLSFFACEHDVTTSFVWFRSIAVKVQ